MSTIAFWIANFVFVIHICFGVYVLTGWLWPAYYAWYWVALGSWIGSWILLGYCPLTRLEFSLRRLYDKTIDPKREIIQYYIQNASGYLSPHQPSLELVCSYFLY
jgi:hypothetical protein